MGRWRYATDVEPTLSSVSEDKPANQRVRWLRRLYGFEHGRQFCFEVVAGWYAVIDRPPVVTCARICQTRQLTRRSCAGCMRLYYLADRTHNSPVPRINANSYSASCNLARLGQPARTIRIPTVRREINVLLQQSALQLIQSRSNLAPESGRAVSSHTRHRHLLRANIFTPVLLASICAAIGCHVFSIRFTLGGQRARALAITCASRAVLNRLCRCPIIPALPDRRCSGAHQRHQQRLQGFGSSAGRGGTAAGGENGRALVGRFVTCGMSKISITNNGWSVVYHRLRR